MTARNSVSTYVMKKINKDTRYFIDLDLSKGKILDWGYDDRHTMDQYLSNRKHHRVFLTKGQYNKMLERHSAL